MINILAVFIASMSSATIATDHIDETLVPVKFNNELVNYERTGKMTHALKMDQIQDWEIVDASKILFQLKPKKIYLSTLPENCKYLKEGHNLSFDLIFGEIRANQKVKILDKNENQLGHCTLGEFEQVRWKKSKQKDA